MMGLLRAAAQVGSLALNALRSQPVNLIGPAGFDEMFDEPAASFWADEQPLIGEQPPSIPSMCKCSIVPVSGDAPEPAAAQKLPETPVYDELVNAAHDGDVARFAATVLYKSDELLSESLKLWAAVVFPQPSSSSSSAGGEVRSDTSGPPVEECPAPIPFPRRGAGHPKLTRDELMDLANAAGHMKNSVGVAATEQHWADLQRRLEDAAIAAPQ